MTGCIDPSCKRDLELLYVFERKIHLVADIHITDTAG